MTLSFPTILVNVLKESILWILYVHLSLNVMRNFCQTMEKVLFFNATFDSVTEAVACQTEFACHCAMLYEIHSLEQSVHFEVQPKRDESLITVLTTISYINVWTSSTEDARSEENRSLLGPYSNKVR